MRLWSISPKYLDTKGLLALWRESLLAKKVLEGGTKGYKNHPQLKRFKLQTDPIAAINFYLSQIYLEASKRGYKFAQEKFSVVKYTSKIPIKSGQKEYEWKHLQIKLSIRDPIRQDQNQKEVRPQLHPIFTEIEGDIEDWEKV